MKREGGTHRKIFESQIQKPVRAETWRAIADSMKEAKMPFTVENLKFVAKCKKIASYHRVKASVLSDVITAAAQLPEDAYGCQIMQCVFRINPNLNRDKFYRAFRTTGFKFKQSIQFKVSDLGEVLYKIFVER